MFGKFWRRSKVTCQYPRPEHSGDKKNGEEDRTGVNLGMAQAFGEVVPIGSGSFVIISINTVPFLYFR